MLQVQYTADPVDLDEPVHAAKAERPDKPVHVRLQPSVLRASGNHVAWKGVAWTVACPSVDEAVAVRKALEAFFVAIATVGIARVTEALTPPAG